MLRQYQKKLITDASKALSGHRSIIATMPTGSGKTFAFAEIAKRATEKGHNTLILTDRIELMNQTGGALDVTGLEHSLIKSGDKHTLSAGCHIAMVETLNSRLKVDLNYQLFLKNKTLIIIDECHKANFDKLFIYFSAAAFIIGFTATPLRLGKRTQLSKYYNQIVSGPQINELQESGYLSRAVTYGKEIDLSSVRVRGEDYDSEDQRRVYSKIQVFSGFYKNWKSKAVYRKTLIFCASVKASRELCEKMNQHGERCEHIDGGMEKEERAAILSRFHTGETMQLSSISILTTGFDEPSVSCIVLYRATKSLPLFLQMIGRGSRIADGKNNFLIMDFGNNISRFGFWEENRDWSLIEKKNVKLRKPGAAPVKLCPKCEAMLFTSARVCRYCGHEMSLTKEEKRFSELAELRPNEITGRQLTVIELEKYRQVKGYKLGWLLRQLRTRSQFEEYGRLMGYKSSWAFVMTKKYTR